MQRLIYIWLLALVLLLIPGSAQAHANLVESTPAANSVVAEAPPTARLKFSEPLEPEYSRVVLAGPDGPITTSPSRVAPDDQYTLLLDLPALPEGQYSLQWRTLSTADGHTMEGIVPFAIGDPAAANAPLVLPPPPPNPLAAPPTAEVALRWLTLLGLSIALGSLIFRSLVWQPQVADDAAVSATFDRRARRLELGAAGIAVFAVLGMLIVSSSKAESNVFAFVAGSRVGLLLALRLALVLGLLAALWIAHAHRRLLGLTLGIAALLSISLLSHSAVPQSQGSAISNGIATAIAIGFDLLHLLATSAWIGGLPALLLGLLALRQLKSGARGHAATLIVARFTGIATAAVVTLAATGTYAAFQHLGGVSELWTTTYGRALSIKLLLFAVLLLLGGYNRWWVHPRLTRPKLVDPARSFGHLRLSVAIEIGASLLLLLMVGVLTASTPAKDAINRGPGYADTARVGQNTLSLQIVRGDIAGDIYAVTVRGLPPNVEPEAVLRTSMPGHGMGEQELKLQQVEPGRWGARGSLLAMPGQYAVETIVRAIGMDDVQHIFTVDTNVLSGTQTTGGINVPFWAVLLIGGLVLAGLSQVALPRRWQTRLQTSSLLFVVAAFIATTVPYYFARASETTNPLSATPEVLAAGKTIYQQNCVACHGVDGRGNGPAARSLPGLPADFTVPHFATHSDADLFGWIKGGKPGTAMPGFGQRLNDEQIWQVLTYIRQIYKDAQQAGMR